MTAAGMWHGNDAPEAVAMHGRALAEGVSELRARILGSVASWRDCWTLQNTLAKFHKCSLRTVQRALRSGRLLGLIGCAFSKPGEVPPGKTEAVPFKWSHRWTIGRGKAGAALAAAIAAARARALVVISLAPPKKRAFNPPQAAKTPKPAPVAAHQMPPGLTLDERIAWLEAQVSAIPPEPVRSEPEPEPPERT